MSTDNTINQRPCIGKIKDLIDLVRSERDITNPYFPMPSVSDSISFARTENAEALDATLRATGLYSRNHEKDELPEHEAAQSLWMILTAIVALQDYERNNNTPPPSLSRSTHLNVLACKSLCDAFLAWRSLGVPKKGYGETIDTVYYYLYQAVHYTIQEIRCYGSDERAELTAELARVRAKRVPKEG